MTHDRKCIIDKKSFEQDFKGHFLSEISEIPYSVAQ